MTEVRQFRDDYIQATCTRCGTLWSYPDRYVTRPEFDGSQCKDCKARPLTRVGSGLDYCTPWHGHFDEDDNPMQNGKLYKPGIRTCGHRDCVRPMHIIPYPNVSGN